MNKSNKSILGFRVEPAGAAHARMCRGECYPHPEPIESGWLARCGRKGVVRFPASGEPVPELFLSGPNIVGLAFLPSRAMVVATNNALYRVDVDIQGMPLV